MAAPRGLSFVALSRSVLDETESFAVERCGLPGQEPPRPAGTEDEGATMLTLLLTGSSHEAVAALADALAGAALLAAGCAADGVRLNPEPRRGVAAYVLPVAPGSALDGSADTLALVLAPWDAGRTVESLRALCASGLVGEVDAMGVAVRAADTRWTHAGPRLHEVIAEVAGADGRSRGDGGVLPVRFWSGLQDPALAEAARRLARRGKEAEACAPLMRAVVVRTAMEVAC